MKDKHEKTAEQLKKELLITGQENESLSIQIPTLRHQIETTRLECRKEMEKIKTEAERKIREAEVECEAIRVSKSNDQLKAKESRTAFEKAVALHQTLTEQMKSDAANMRMELEKIISDERSVNQVSEEVNASLLPQSRKGTSMKRGHYLQGKQKQQSDSTNLLNKPNHMIISLFASLFYSV
jgi:hypothetical protein